ncbi:cyclin-dependent kinase B1-1-like [Trifolium pratense]|uniref:cyclin-dependent kinase B1-1-like n=1 Tax=Trifolium pratense TaxID=57577 RepID=UPI001E696BAE|nr:cyclin-dependent kinase B1-1-like [Trifolium pratense]XP_045832198.1 cyclin-dependent kinase B1-1-like [Trifolium pratense]
MGDPCYKAPELLLGFTNYIWSMGCIFAEMIKFQPLFIGNDGPKILTEIFCLLGMPTEENWPGVASMCSFIEFEAFDPPIKPKDLAAEFPKLEPDGLDLLSKMLCLCPNSRISAEEADDKISKCTNLSLSNKLNSYPQGLFQSRQDNCIVFRNVNAGGFAKQSWFIKQLKLKVMIAND